MKIFNKYSYVAIGIHVPHDYTNVLIQNISWIQGYPSHPAEVMPQGSFQ